MTLPSAQRSSCILSDLRSNAPPLPHPDLLLGVFLSQFRRLLPPGLARGFLWAGGLITALLLAQKLHGMGWWKVVDLPNAKMTATESGWRMSMPEKYRGALADERGIILENGAPIGLKELRRHDFEQTTGGRFVISRGVIALRPGDESDPTKNGRRYSLKLPAPVPGWVLGLSSVVLAAGLLGSRPRGGAFRFQKWLPILVAVVGFAGRAAEVQREPEFDDGIMSIRGMLYSDAMMWNELALSLVEGRGLTGGFSGQRPYYSYLLGSVYAAAGPSVTAGRLLNAAAHGLTLGLACLLGCALSSWIGGVAAAAALYFAGQYWHMVQVLMTETVASLLAMAGCCLLLAWPRKPETTRGRWLRLGSLLMAGVMLALSNLTCPSTLLALPLLCILVCLRRRQPGQAWWQWIDLRPGLAVSIGAFLVLGPWLVRQYRVQGVATLSTQTGDLLYAAAMPEGRMNPREMEELAAAGISPHAGPTAERYRFFMKRFVDTVRANPSAYFQKLGGYAWEFADSSEWAIAAFRAVSLLGLLVGGLVWWRQSGGSGTSFLAALPVGAALWFGALAPGWALVLPSVVILFLLRPGSRPVLGVLVCLLMGAAACSTIAGLQLVRRTWVSAEPVFWLLLFGAATTLQGTLAGWLDRRLKIGESLGADGPISSTDVTAPASSVLVWGTCGGVAGLSLFGAVAFTMGRPIPVPAPLAAGSRQSLVDWIHHHAPEAASAIGDLDKSLVLTPVRIGEYRAFVPAGIEVTNFARSFLRKPFDRTVAFLRPAPQADGSIWVQLTQFAEVDLRKERLAGWWLLASWPDVDPKSRFGHDITIHRAVALFPLAIDGTPEWERGRKFAVH